MSRHLETKWLRYMVNGDINMAFLKDDYKIPEGTMGNYMKFVEGENKFVILSEALTGWLYWVTAAGEVVPRGELGGEGSKPMRVPELADCGEAQYDAKAFWAFKVYNIATDKVQILEITQRTLMKAIDALIRSKDWGDPFTEGYCITVTKSGKGMDTEYSVIPSPKKKLDINQAEVDAINIDALLTGEDPFIKNPEDVKPSEIPF